MCFLVTSVTSSFMQPSQCSSRLSDDPDLSMNGVFFVCVLSIASIVHFAAVLLISFQSRQYQSALLIDVLWSHDFSFPLGVLLARV